jgi:hypothetical protein
MNPTETHTMVAAKTTRTTRANGQAAKPATNGGNREVSARAAYRAGAIDRAAGPAREQAEALAARIADLFSPTALVKARAAGAAARAADWPADRNPYTGPAGLQPLAEAWQTGWTQADDELNGKTS